ncbi:hypothetical protein GALMADRAFT_222750 [Galerina marginata CBS 339.88]|uniref:Uncharacterized protein n=1 Tax=Galerina marginata (strain CBS 339.88) TaxID=685588 RepID=A0A067TII0_GALM3|nr:hypothetical protein GALMADRAFT_222750 [Galerina marginata CBS 339.88]
MASMSFLHRYFDWFCFIYKSWMGTLVVIFSAGYELTQTTADLLVNSTTLPLKLKYERAELKGQPVVTFHATSAAV